MKHMKTTGRVLGNDGKMHPLYIGKKYAHGTHRVKRHPNSKYVTSGNHK